MLGVLGFAILIMIYFARGHFEHEGGGESRDVESRTSVEGKAGEDSEKGNVYTVGTNNQPALAYQYYVRIDSTGQAWLNYTSYDTIPEYPKVVPTGYFYVRTPRQDLLWKMFYIKHGDTVLCAWGETIAQPGTIRPLVMKPYTPAVDIPTLPVDYLIQGRKKPGVR
jgi:hypothetical protein